VVVLQVIQVLPVWEWRVGKKKQGLGFWGGPGSRQEVASPGRVEEPDDKQAQGELALLWSGLVGKGTIL